MQSANDNRPRLISPKDAAVTCNLSRPALYYLAERGEYPKPVRLSDKRIAFVRAEVEAWVDQRIAARAA